MARDTKQIEADDKKEPVSKFVLRHNLESGQIIALRRNQQKHLWNLPGYENINLRLCDKQGDNRIYFEATPSQAKELVKRLGDTARSWSYQNVNLDLDEVEKAPDGVLSSEETARLEEKSAGLIEELNRAYMRIGSLQANLDVASGKISALEVKCSNLDSAKSSVEDEHMGLQLSFSELEKAYDSLKMGNFSDSIKELVKLRIIKLSDLEMFLSEIKDSGLDFGFIANPPESLEKYVEQKIIQLFGITSNDFSKRLRIGAVEWQKSEIYMPESDKVEALAKVDGLLKTIETADVSVKQIVADSLGKLVDSFKKKVSEYEGRFDEWQKAKETFVAYESAMHKGKDDLASAKGLQGCLADIRQVKLPVYAVPEQDGSISLFTPVSSGIIYDSLMAAVGANANLSSEPQNVEGNTVLRITPKEGSLKVIDLLNAIKTSYWNSEAGRMGNKLGLIVQL